MFLTSQRGYTKGGEQWAKGSFLILFSYNPYSNTAKYQESKNGLFACVRNVKLKQLGHWMMAIVKIGQLEVSLSGTYGHDGLTCDWKPEMAPWLHSVPEELKDIFWKGEGGHNSAGSEGPMMRDWAIKNEKLLRSKVKK